MYTCIYVDCILPVRTCISIDVIDLNVLFSYLNCKKVGVYFNKRRIANLLLV